MERASPGDRAFLAMDTGGVPQQVGVILMLEHEAALTEERVRRLVAQRIAAVPRLRQRLLRVPFGSGAPIWVDDARFDIAHHVRSVACPDPGDERALLDAALSLIMERLPATRPLWSAVLVTGLAGGRAALVVVMHHVLADGIGGLTVLLNLVDQIPATQDQVPFPRRPPTRGQLAADAVRGRLRALRHLRRSWRLLRASMKAGGGLRPPRAHACSLIQRTGPRRGLAVVRVDISSLASAAHRNEATTNDALLVAVAGALHRLLIARGEYIDSFAFGVPVSGRTASGPALGNVVSPLLVNVPATGDIGRRLQQVAAEVRAHKAAARGPAPIAVLGWLFRPLAALGGYRWYMNHQHRMHTLVSYVRGPHTSLAFDATPVSAAIPVAVGEGGNLTVYFQALSYAGSLTVSAITDPDHFPDSSRLIEELSAQLAHIQALRTTAEPVRRAPA